MKGPLAAVLIAVACLAAPAVAQPAVAQPATRPADVTDLLRRLTPISTSDPDLRTLQATGRLPSFAGLAYRFDVAFERGIDGEPNRHALVIRDDADGMPLLVSAGGTTILYHPVARQIITVDGGLAAVMARSNGDLISLNVGVSRLFQGEHQPWQLLVDLDPRSLMYTFAVLDRSATFDPAAPLGSLTARPGDEGRPVGADEPWQPERVRGRQPLWVGRGEPVERLRHGVLGWPGLRRTRRRGGGPVERL